MGLALRDLRLPIDGSSLHGNCERPGYFMGWLAILESTLPAKGVAYRRNNNDDKELQPQLVNVFSQSVLWKLQGLALDDVPPALGEQSFTVPAVKSFLVSNDARRNLTDQQETSQWIAGAPVFTKFISAALSPLVESCSKCNFTNET